MKKSTGFISLLLCAAMAASALASCSEKPEDNTADNITDEVTEAVETVEEEELDSLEARKKVSDNLPEADYEGADFNMLVQEEFSYDGFVEEDTGDALEEAIYNRNQRIEERFKINLACEALHYDKIGENVRKTVNSDDDAYQLVMNHIIRTGSDVIKGVYSDWNGYEYIDTTRPWYTQYAVNDCVVNGKRFILISDATISSYEQTFCVYFNKAIASDYNISDGDFYSWVRNGEWTIDKYSETAAKVYNDLNGNGRRDKGDVFGNEALVCYSNNALWAFEQPLVELSDEGIEIVLNTEKTVEIIDKMYDLYYNNEGTFIVDSYPGIKTDFRDGSSLFLMCHFYPALHELREMEQDYGIIPYPKWNEEQQNYKTCIDGSFDVLVSPKTCRDTEMVSIITEAISAESWKSVQTVFYDIALKVKGARDEESIEMIDIVLGARTVDFSWVYCGWDGFNFMVQDMVGGKKSGNQFASYYEKNLKPKTRAYNKAYDYFYEG